MKHYWVSAIIQNKGDIKPWLCSAYESKYSLDEAMEVVKYMKENYTVLSI